MLNIPLCNLKKCFDLSLSYNHAVNPDETFICDLCLYLEMIIL